MTDFTTAIRDSHPTERIVNTADTLPHVVEDTDAINMRIRYYVTAYGSGYNATVRLVGKEEEPTHNEYGEIAP